jgi:hypothetical protein
LLEKSTPNQKSHNLEASLSFPYRILIRAAFITASSLPRCFLIPQCSRNKTTSLEKPINGNASKSRCAGSREVTLVLGRGNICSDLAKTVCPLEKVNFFLEGSLF